MEHGSVPPLQVARCRGKPPQWLDYPYAQYLEGDTVYWVLVNRETKCETERNRSHTYKFTTSTQAHHSTHIFPCAVWLAPGLDSVSEVRLMLFSVYSLLLQLLILLLTVLESFSHCMLTVDIFTS